MLKVFIKDNYKAPTIYNEDKDKDIYSSHKWIINDKNLIADSGETKITRNMSTCSCGAIFIEYKEGFNTIQRQIFIDIGGLMCIYSEADHMVMDIIC